VFITSPDGRTPDLDSLFPTRRLALTFTSIVALPSTFVTPVCVADLSPDLTGAATLRPCQRGDRKYNCRMSCVKNQQETASFEGMGVGRWN
jgi:hypothetical protein